MKRATEETWGAHSHLRLLLTKSGNTPWNYARFLDHAVKHRFIQRTGGRYRFVHDLLQKHFAAMPLEYLTRDSALMG